MYRSGDTVWHVLHQKPLIVLGDVKGTDFVDCAEYHLESDGSIHTKFRRCCKINVRQHLKVLTFT